MEQVIEFTDSSIVSLTSREDKGCYVLSIQDRAASVVLLLNPGAYKQLIESVADQPRRAVQDARRQYEHAKERLRRMAGDNADEILGDKSNPVNEVLSRKAQIGNR